MKNLLVDPFLCTIPESDATLEDLQRWLEGLQRWVVEINSSTREWRHLLDCTYQLEQNQRRVSFRSLLNLQQRFGLELNPAWLGRMIDQFFLDETKDAKACFRTKYAYATEESVRVTPLSVVERNVSGVQSELVTGLLCWACDCCLGEEFASNTDFVTLDTADSEEQLRIEAEIALTEPDAVMSELRQRIIAHSFKIVCSPDDLGSMRAADVIEEGEDEFICTVAKLSRVLFGVDEPLTCKWHPKFRESLTESSIIQSHSGLESFLRASAAIVAQRAAEIKGLKLRPCRESKAGDSPQRHREVDGAKAWRVTLEQSGVGWRLNYWQVPARGSNSTDSVELAWVERKTTKTFIPD